VQLLHANSPAAVHDYQVEDALPDFFLMRTKRSNPPQETSNRSLHDTINIHSYMRIHVNINEQVELAAAMLFQAATVLLSDRWKRQKHALPNVSSISICHEITILEFPPVVELPHIHEIQHHAHPNIMPSLAYEALE
jgi:hypothetical protein